MELKEYNEINFDEDETQIINSEKNKKYELKNYIRNSPIILETTGGAIIDGFYRKTQGDGSSIVIDSVSEFPLKYRSTPQVPVCYSAYEIKYLHIYEDPQNNFNEACPFLGGITYKNLLDAKKLIWNIKYIPVYDCNFQETVKSIRNHDVIGILAAGAHSQKTTAATISCFLISTRNQIYIFDIQFTPKNFWEMGLKKILEDPKIKKIVYDSKTIAYILYNRYKIKIFNVFDVMVADYEISKKNNDVPNQKKLPELLEKYLKLPRGMFSYTEFILKGCTHINRPLSDNMKQNLSLNVVFLIYLHNTQNALLLKDFYMASQKYSNVKNNEDVSIDFLCDVFSPGKVNGYEKLINGFVDSGSSSNSSVEQKNFSETN